MVRIAAAVVGITPNRLAPLAGFGGWCGTSTSVMSALEANLIAVPSAAGRLILSNVDAPFMSRDLVDANESEVRLTPAGDDLNQVVMVASVISHHIVELLDGK